MKLIKKNINKIKFKILPIYFIGISVINFILTIVNPKVPKDLYTEFYYGARFLKGDFIFVNEIHDKFPFVQILMTIPGFLKSERSWVILSALFLSLSCILFFTSIKDLFRFDWKIKNIKLVNEICLIGATSILYSISILNNGFLEINCIAASSIVISICLGLNYSGPRTNKNNLSKYILSAFFASIAISIRPYYLFSVILLSLWMILRKEIIKNSLTKYNRNTIKILFSSFKWLLLVFIFGLILNTIPYFINGEVISFFNGLRDLMQDLSPQQSLSNIIRWQVEILLISSAITLLVPLSLSISFYFILNLLFFKNKSNLLTLQNIDLICGGFLLLFLLQLIIITKHFWSHYYQLMMPFAIISSSLLVIYYLNQKNLYVFLKIIKTLPINLVLIILLVSIFRGDIYNTLVKFKNIDQLSSSKIYIKDVENYLISNKKKNFSTDFLFPENMYVHWKYNQTRYKFPHSQNIADILENEWLGIKKEINIRVPSSPEEYCTQLLNYSPEIIFTTKNSFEENCLSQSNNTYKKDKETDLLTIFYKTE